MASEKEIYEIIGRAVADKKFRENLNSDPEGAAKALGYSLTPEPELRRCGTLRLREP